jgi:hypothetical protein
MASDRVRDRPQRQVSAANDNYLAVISTCH